ncbi:MAG: hypothetical protein HYY02_12760 [Chloroflexi bacterium]|nr:hypothetical protein [Chloroflexota bacterium]
MTTSQAAQGYSALEMMFIAAAREMVGKGIIFMGMSYPMLAGTLAKLGLDPNLQFCTEPGVIDWAPPADLERAPVGVADPVLLQGAASCGDMTDTLCMALMGGDFFDLAALPIAQVDRFGNGNTITIGNYNDPVQRFNGVGGNTDGACLAPAVMFVVPHERRRFLERVDFITSPGYIDGPGGRGRAGLAPQGPNLVVTTLGILRFHTPDGGVTGSCQAYLDTVYTGVAVEEVVAKTGWPLQVSPDLKVMSPPTQAELDLLRRLDPLHSYLREGRGDL